MVVVGLYGHRGCHRVAALTVPCQLTTIDVAQHESQFRQLTLQGRDAVGLLDSQCLQSCEMEGYAQGTAGDDDGLCQVGGIDEVIVQSRHAVSVLSQYHGSGASRLLAFECGAYA